MKAEAPQSHFLKCFDLSNQSARVTSSLLLPVSPQFLIKAPLLAGCPWSARNSRSHLRKESNIQRLNPLTLFSMFHRRYRWNRTWIQRSPSAFINTAEAFHGANICVITWCCLCFTALEKKSWWAGNEVDMKLHHVFHIIHGNQPIWCLCVHYECPSGIAEWDFLVSELPSGTFQHSSFILWTGKWREAQQLEKWEIIFKKSNLIRGKKNQ